MFEQIILIHAQMALVLKGFNFLLVAFCMTITKAQDQTCERLGIDFSDEPFAHGQLYTALSRVRSSEFIRIYAPGKTRDPNGNISIRNVVANSIVFD